MFESIQAHIRLRRLLRNWTAAHELFRAGRGMSRVPIEEKRLLALKAHIARDLPVLETSVPPAYIERAQRGVARITELLGSVPIGSSEGVKGPAEPRVSPPSGLEEPEKAWDEVFLLLNQLTGLKLMPRLNRSAFRRRRVPNGLPRTRVLRRTGRFGAGMVRLVFQVAVFAILIYVAARGIGIHRGAAGRIVADPPETIGILRANLMSGTHALMDAFGRLMHPVVGTYGFEVTLGLVAVLLMALGYWAFVRNA
jgi:hypothetical protein